MSTIKFIYLFFCSLSIASLVCAHTTPLDLAEDDWHQMLNGEWMVEFYAPWCPACKALQPVWQDFSTWSRDLQIKVAKVDVTTAPGLPGRFMVTALPTIFHVYNGEFRQYRGGRDKDSLISFVDEKKWKEIEPIPSWKSPDSFIMSIVSYFFKLSTVLRSLHNQMVDEFGIPIWGSYAVFGVATIIIGTLLGLILVCCIDCLCPPKSLRQPPVAPMEEAEEGEDMEDLLDEDAESNNERYLESEEEYEGSQAEDTQDSQEEIETQVADDLSPTMRKRKSRKAD